MSKLGLRTRAALSVTAVAAAALGFSGMTAGVATANTHASVLKYGASGHGVWCGQRIINRNYPHALKEDAKYGTYTKAWVKYVQEHHGLTGRNADGIVGKKTGTKLLASIGGDTYCHKYLPAQK
ncbi:peptidoglycan-binding protein [Streptomyces sp. NPDC052301]|uniref:peptidoglycan-binding protein n=1 Tax=Streptomyces sp. NPDC052301 TaxID=3365687 RepID=UPI0037CE1834